MSCFHHPPHTNLHSMLASTNFSNQSLNTSLRGTTSIACEVLLRKLDPTLGAIVGPCLWGTNLFPTLRAIANGGNACSKEGFLHGYLHDRQHDRHRCLLSKESISSLARGLAIALGHFLPQDDCIICITPPCPNIVLVHIALDDCSYPPLDPCLEKTMVRFHGLRGQQYLHVLHERFESLLVLLRSHC